MNEKNAERVSKALNNMKKLVEHTEQNFEIRRRKSSANHAKTLESVRHLANEMMKDNPFAPPTLKSSYSSFPRFNGEVLEDLKVTPFLKWVKRVKTDMEKMSKI